jgi:hypothetical protein
MMDSAGNCNTTATSLVPLNPHFKGTPWRGYCSLHIIQLSAKVPSFYLSLLILAYWSNHNREVAQKTHAAFKAARGNILFLLRSITGTLK